MSLEVAATALPEVLLLKPRVFRDERGFFLERFNRRAFEKATGTNPDFCQDNHSVSTRGVLRGLHYQLPPAAQGKLVWVAEGRVRDVAVDIRRSSPTFGQSVVVDLDAESADMLWIPPGFAHGFLVLSSQAVFLYKTTAYYAPSAERTVRWDDPDLAIDWGDDVKPVVSKKDASGIPFSSAETFA